VINLLHHDFLLHTLFFREVNEIKELIGCDGDQKISKLFFPLPKDPHAYYDIRVDLFL
jgi:hypothetical protein